MRAERSKARKHCFILPPKGWNALQQTHCHQQSPAPCCCCCWSGWSGDERIFSWAHAEKWFWAASSSERHWDHREGAPAVPWSTWSRRLRKLKGPGGSGWALPLYGAPAASTRAGLSTCSALPSKAVPGFSHCPAAAAFRISEALCATHPGYHDINAYLPSGYWHAGGP